MSVARTTALAMLRSGCSFLEAASLTGLTVEEVIAAWAEAEAAGPRDLDPPAEEPSA